MGLDKILAISGKPGLYELTAQSRGGFIVKSIPEGKKMAVNIRHNVSLLSEIAIYTYTEEVPLAEIFEKMKEKENGGEAISHKSNKAELEKYFAEVFFCQKNIFAKHNIHQNYLPKTKFCRKKNITEQI